MSRILLERFRFNIIKGAHAVVSKVKSKENGDIFACKYTRSHDEEILLYNFPDFKKEYFAKIAANKSTIEHILINENSTIV